MTDTDKDDQTQGESQRSVFYTDWRFYLILAYVAIMLFFLLAELDVPKGLLHAYRATNQVIVLVTLLFVPFFLFLASSVVQKFKLRLPNGQEIEVELGKISSTAQKLDRKIDEQSSIVSKTTKNLVGRVDMAEQALLPIILGTNPTSRQRLEKGELIIGSKEFAEQQIVSNVIAALVRRELSEAGIRVKRRIPNGSSYKNFADLRYGWIDGYVEYAGTGMMLMMQLDEFFDQNYTLEQTVAKLDQMSRERFGIAWLKPIGLHNEYVLVLDRKISEKYKVTKISQLLAVCDKVDFCFTLEFYNRRDGLDRLRQKYQLSFRREFDVGIDERYRMMEQGQAQLTSGFATDPEIEDSSYVVLDDDDGIFPDYHAVPVFRVEALERIHGLEDAINSLENTIDNRCMMGMIKECHRSGNGTTVVRGIAERFTDELLDDANRNTTV